MSTNAKIMIVGSRRHTTSKIINLIEKNLFDDMNVIITDDAAGSIRKQTKDLVTEAGYRIVELNPYSSTTEKIHLLDAKTPEERREISHTLPEYLFGEVFMGEAEKRIPPARYVWARMLINYAVTNRMTMEDMKQFISDTTTDELFKILEINNLLWEPIVSGEPIWRKRDNINGIKEIIEEKLAEEKELSWMSDATYDLHDFFQERTIIYLSPVTRSGLTPFVMERILQIDKNTGLSYTVVMDEVSLVRKLADRNWTANVVVRFGTFETPAARKIQALCPSTYICT